jgi:hypothetical protein
MTTRLPTKGLRTFFAIAIVWYCTISSISSVDRGVRVFECSHSFVKVWYGTIAYSQ